MTNVFKKTGIAAAVAGALMAVSGGVYAQAYLSLEGNEIALAAPDDVMLVPHVVCDPAATGGQVNTLVGITTIFPGRVRDPLLLGRPDRRTSKGTGASLRNMHWRFYDDRSNHRLDGVIPVTDNDFIRYDWCDQLAKSGQTSLNGVPGYLLFHADSIRFNLPGNVLVGESELGTSATGTALHPAENNAYNRHEYSNCADDGCPAGFWSSLSITLPAAEGKTATTKFDTSVLVQDGTNADGTTRFAFNRSMWLYGHSYLIQGNWGSQAFIPILSAPIWDAVVRNGYPAIERLDRGIDFTTVQFGTATYYQNIVMRYFLDPALSTRNRMVFWFNTNQDAVRGAVPVETFDSEQVYQFSFTEALPKELNIVDSTPGNPRYPGMIHTGNDPRGSVVNTGLIHFYVPQVNSTVPYISSGVAFNLLSLGAGGNNAQVQTEMATGGYDLMGPF